tara:strand:+ start:1261 stop:1836 length:576 start_codon:yes stop_codon:yes gene_type:complete
MANHVYFNITSDEPMENCFKSEKFTRDYGNGPFELTELVNVCNQPFMQEAIKDEEVDEDGWPKDSWNWHVDNCGAKWVNLEDADESYLQGYSAWSPPIPMLEHLAKFAGVELRMTYEDEFRNFIGVAWADDEGLSSYHEIEGNDLTDQMLEELELEELPEDFDWWESQDKLNGQSAGEYIDDAVYNWFENQ